MIRFDDLTREERYYSATILPYLLAFNKFSGLSAFESVLLERKLIRSYSTINDNIQLLTEIYIERDLPFYRIEIPSESFKNKMGVQAKPDLMILSQESIYIFECKVFMNESEYKLHQQILKQKYVFDIIENTTRHTFMNKLHFLILPYEYYIEDCVVFTWNDIYGILKPIIPAEDYFLKRLAGAINRLSNY